MLYERQRLLLTLLDSLGGDVSGTDFQKLLLIYTREWETEPSYEFVPYHFGSFSFTSYADKRRLVERGLLENNEHRWVLSKDGRAAGREQRGLAARTQRFANTQTQRGDALVAETYRRFPYFASRSKIIARVLPSLQQRAAIDAAKPMPRGPGLVTIGYEGRSLEGYLNLLLQDSVTILCDVRRNPLSRKYGFSKSTLRSACQGVGIRYEHLPELGIASEERRDLITQQDYDALFDVYKRESLPNQGAALSQILRWIETDQQRVALTCYESEPCQCHRHCVSAALERQMKRRCAAVHL